MNLELRTSTLRVEKIYCLPLAIILAFTEFQAQAATKPPQTATQKLQEILTIADWPPERFDTSANQPKLTLEEYRELASLNRTLKRIAPLLTEAAIDTPKTGRAIRIVGTITSVEAIDASPPYYRCRVKIEQGNKAELIVPSVPNDWLKLNPLAQPITASGIYVAGNESRPAIIVSPHIAWHPSAIEPNLINFGETVLGSAGYDVGLLDSIADAQAILSRETDAFYKLLDTAGQFGANQLIRFAEGNIKRFAKLWVEMAGDQPLSIVDRVVVAQAAKSRYSVAPLFNDARRQRGNLFVFDGLVRRAVRVAVDSTRYPFDHYYELELFTDDSQNLPLVCCVRDLPAGFPTGDKIAQDVRIAGFLFKRWAYRTRKPNDSGVADGVANNDHDKRQLAPLLIGRAPVMLLPDPRSNRAAWELGGGITFAAILVIIWLLLTRQSRNDQSFSQSLRERFNSETKELI